MEHSGVPGWRTALQRAQQALAEGQAWRAREMLQGWVAQVYHPALYRTYGEALWTLGDRYAAGRYLFLAGVPPQEEGLGQAVRDFLARHRRTPARALLGDMPVAFRRQPPSAWPEVVVEAVTARAEGEPLPRVWEAVRPHPRTQTEVSPWWGRLLGACLLYVLLSALVGTGFLCWVVLRWLGKLW